MEYTEARVKDIFVDFLKGFKDSRNELKYRTAISGMPGDNKKSIVIDYPDLLAHNTDLAVSILRQPELFLKAFDLAAIDTLTIENPVYADKVKKELHVRLRELTDRISLRGVTKENLNMLILVAGMVTRTSELRPLAVTAAFRCSSGHITHVEQSGSILKKPIKCEEEGCGETKNFELDDMETEFVDFQVIRIQEMPEELPPGQLPQSFDVHLMGDIVNSARPGDRIVLTGIVKAEPAYAGTSRLREFTNRIVANYVEQIGKRPEEIEIDREEEEKIKAIAAAPGAYDRLINSVAPAIFGHELHKEAALMLMVGSPQKTLPDGSTLRGDINLLLVGDPGTAKSELLKYVARIAPRGLYTSGRGTTAAGLTAAVVKEKNGMMMLEAGATVLADLGIACIDEFDKMRDEDRSALHEVMEQQSYHPSVQIALSDGRRVTIGKYVEKLFAENSSKIVNGRNCEILPLSEGDELYSSDISSGNISRIKVDRVSRHIAPESFVEIKYSNGRKILVTPEHPIFVYHNSTICTIPACQVSTQHYVPVPKFVPNSSLQIPLVQRVEREFKSKRITLPKILTEELARLLGFLISEGHSYAGSSYEIGFSNTDGELLDQVRRLFETSFGITPSVRIDRNGVTTLRYISKPLFEWFDENFHEIMFLAREKRVPPKILGSSVKLIREFLSAAFLGDGSVESTSICYRTASPNLAEDYQDLLHKLGIISRIAHDRSSDSFKVYIMGDCLSSFVDQVVEKYDKRLEILDSMRRRSLNVMRSHDTLPPDIASELTKLMKALGIAYSNYFYEHIKYQFGVNVPIVEKYLAIIEDRLNRLEQFTDSVSISSLKESRMALGLSQQKLAAIAEMKRGTIAYLENGGYPDESEKLIMRIKDKVRIHHTKLRAESNRIKSLLSFRFLRVSEVGTVPNSGGAKTEWVYDVTVEPTNTFISKGVILHNTASVAKGGIIATLNARTSILAAANPADGKYDPYKNILDNVLLPVPLLTRFDLIFIIRDEPDPAKDENVAKHILDMRAKSTFPVTPPIDFDLLKKYIIYAKKLDPELTEEARERLSSFYIKMRREAAPDQLSVTPRWLEGLIRLAIARSRVLLHTRVTDEDALNAIKLMERMLQTVAVDQATKKVDIGVLYNKPISEKGLRETALEVFKRLSGETKQPVEDKAFYEEMEKTGKFNREQSEKVFQDMWKSGVIYESKPHFFKKA